MFETLNKSKYLEKSDIYFFFKAVGTFLGLLLLRWRERRAKKVFFFASRTKKACFEGQSSPQELEVGLCSGPYLLVRRLKALLSGGNIALTY